MNAVLQCFREELLHRPYRMNDSAYGVRILPKNTIALARFIQQNQPYALYWLSPDVDRMGASTDWSDRNCPAPNTAVKNPRNRHTRLLYAFALPVRTAPDASALVLRYTATIKCALCGKLGTDVDYSGLIYKNPCHPEWQEVE